jgi:hypothetical protein
MAPLIGVPGNAGILHGMQGPLSNDFDTKTTKRTFLPGRVILT